MADDDGSPRALRGKYALTGAAVCVFSNATLAPVYIPPLGFTTNFVPIGHASSNSFSRNGVLTFNKDGTGTSSTRVTAIGDPDPGDSGATSSIDSSSSFTYTVGDDGAFSLAEGTFTSTAVAGPRTGIVTQTSNLPVLTGFVSNDRKTIVFGSFDPLVESTTRVDLGVVESLRVCHRTSTAVRIGSDSDN
jgi:hypothetical protein